MKKSFLKCFAISLGLVLSLQAGSFAAKNITVSNYKPKIQLVGLKKKKIKKKKSVQSFSYEPKTQFVGMNKSEFAGSYKVPDVFEESVDDFINQCFSFLSEKIKENYGINFSINIDTTKHKLKIKDDGSGHLSFSAKSTQTLSGITLKENSTIKIKFIRKGDNLIQLDFSDIFNYLKTYLRKDFNASLLTEEEFNEMAEWDGYYSYMYDTYNDYLNARKKQLTEDYAKLDEIENMFVLSLEKVIFTKEGVERLNTSTSELNSSIKELFDQIESNKINPNLNPGIVENKEYLIVKSPLIPDFTLLVLEKI